MTLHADADVQVGKYSTVVAKVKVPAHKCPQKDHAKSKVGIQGGHSLEACNYATMFARIDLEVATDPACHQFIEVEGCQQKTAKHVVSSVATIGKGAAKDAKCPAKERVKSAQGFGHHAADEANACMMARMIARINLENKVKADCYKYIEVTACKKH